MTVVRGRRAGALRHGVAALALLALVFGVSGCTRGPSEAELAGAADARDDGHQTLAGFDLAAPAGSVRAAHRTVDACGSPTSDRGGFDDRHVMGYECFVVERVVYTPADRNGQGFDVDASTQELSGRLGLTAAETWGGDLYAHGRIEVDGFTVIVEISHDRIDEPSTVGQLPVQGWHANDVVHEDDGDLLDRLPELVAAGESEVLVATVAVRYFRDAPGAPD
ncbi:hypothetical protein [Agromyces sp. NPDC058126]|uniref:hypothetical protein n=1 Tax=Agromyces sp. NPDC058126 TaxID=3346350 RepID=UPI0036DEAA06